MLTPLAVAALSMALGLALSGHTVRVPEKDQGGIRLAPNVTKILVHAGIERGTERRSARAESGIWPLPMAVRALLHSQ
jgi:hypothetical protein